MKTREAGKRSLWKLPPTDDSALEKGSINSNTLLAFHASVNLQTTITGLSRPSPTEPLLESPENKLSECMVIAHCICTECNLLGSALHQSLMSCFDQNTPQKHLVDLSQLTVLEKFRFLEARKTQQRETCLQQQAHKLFTSQPTGKQSARSSHLKVQHSPLRPAPPSKEQALKAQACGGHCR